MNPSPRPCHGCGSAVGPERVYFGSLGPFCSVACREEWIKKSDRYVDNVRQLVRAPMRIGPVADLPKLAAQIQRENAQRQLHLCLDALSRAGDLVIRCAGELAELEITQEIRASIYGLRGTPSVVLGAIAFDELRAALEEHRKARADLDVAVEHARKVGIT
jgi:hypothetical protein